MSHAAPALQEVSKAPVLSTLQHYQVQLNMFKQQKEAAKVQFHQLEGAIFAVEQLIAQHEATLKADVEKLARETAAKANENKGDAKNEK